ncbi:hypothetical protein NHQ30_008543 [Ciborinia camelliae]|nr:hypothetical protein NHQ30_008543 [Ciborinia camelliae]
MATEGVWQNITDLFSGLIIRGDSKGDASSLSTSSKFEGFSRLPEKLRLKIWRYSLPGPRLMRMVGKFGSIRILSSELSHPFHLLHVNKESRKLALTEYSVLRNLSVAPMYINSKRDLLCFLYFDQFESFIKRRKGQKHEKGPVIDKFVVLSISETKRLNVKERMKDIIDTCHYARLIYPDLKKVIFVLDGDQVEEQESENEEKTKKINEETTEKINRRFKEKFGDGKHLDIHLECVTMEDLVRQYDVETDSDIKNGGKYCETNIFRVLQQYLGRKRVSKLNDTDTTQATSTEDTDRYQGKTFTLFPCLPPEIRIIICELALAAATPALPECIRLFQGRVKSKPQDIYDTKYEIIYYRRKLTPELSNIHAMLQVSREFRKVVSKQYGLFNGLFRPLLLRPTVDCFDFLDIDHFEQYIDEASLSSSGFGNTGVMVKRFSIRCYPQEQEFLESDKQYIRQRRA